MDGSVSGSLYEVIGDLVSKKPEDIENLMLKEAVRNPKGAFYTPPTK
jgi:hypothetical protein